MKMSFAVYLFNVLKVYIFVKRQNDIFITGIIHCVWRIIQNKIKWHTNMRWSLL